MSDDTNNLSMNSGDKNLLRKRLRSARRALTAEAQSQAAEALLLRLLELNIFSRSTRIALYLPNDGEIDPSHMIKWCQQNDRHSYLPIVRQVDGRNSLMFAEVKLDSRLEPNRFGILEPEVDKSLWLEARDLDIVLLPLVGFDRAGNRIGMGGGFYDTTFEFLKHEKAKQKPLLIGLAHEIQKVERIEAESWDVPLTMVVTNQSIYHLN